MMETTLQINLSQIAILLSLISPLVILLWKGGGRDKELTALALRVGALEAAHLDVSKSMTNSLNEISRSMIRLDERDKTKSDTINEIRNDVKALAVRVDEVKTMAARGEKRAEGQTSA